MHLLSGESTDIPDGTRSSLLELDALESLMHVKSVVPAGRLHLCLPHLTTNIY